MIIRRLHGNDAEIAFQALTKIKFVEDGTEHLGKSLTIEYLQDFLKNNRHYLLAALDGNTPIGFILAYRLQRVDRNQDMMFFYEINIAKKYRKKGAGIALIKKLKEICRDENIMKMFVLTNRSNNAAYNLYKKTGGIADAAGDEVIFVYQDFT
ncbi:MAG: GNAT family N-acetyltransferase [candidate division WOR-3 bacterium]|nr:MAG: GNAT family N-acetyltransferase [candidate division WOR-3 bacterium]